MPKTINEILDSDYTPTDEELQEMAYGIQYFSFGAATLEYTRARRAKLVQMQKRLEELKEQEKESRKRQRDARQMCDCGHKAEFPMTTPNGTACPRCYDRMSTM